MNLKTKKIIALSAFLLILLNFVVRPYLKKQEGVKVVKKVLSLWKNNDLTFAFNYWQDPQNCPPVYDLQSYKIIKAEFYTEKKVLKARLFIILEFPAGNIMPSGKEWVFEIAYSPVGWQIISMAQVIN
ncbi:MAG: hypothetical protein HQL27_07430 [Candidatus Omnitrophica bacterium]|nr:hypothetical protein [Candidatus Omnitrophota bacterium]